MFEEQGLAEFTGRNENVETTEKKDLPIYAHSQLSMGGCDVKKTPVAVHSHSVLAWRMGDRGVVGEFGCTTPPETNLGDKRMNFQSDVSATHSLPLQ